MLKEIAAQTHIEITPKKHQGEFICEYNQGQVVRWLAAGSELIVQLAQENKPQGKKGQFIFHKRNNKTEIVDLEYDRCYINSNGLILGLGPLLYQVKGANEFKLLYQSSIPRAKPILKRQIIQDGENLYWLGAENNPQQFAAKISQHNCDWQPHPSKPEIIIAYEDYERQTMRFSRMTLTNNQKERLFDINITGEKRQNVFQAWRPHPQGVIMQFLNQETNRKNGELNNFFLYFYPEIASQQKRDRKFIGRGDEMFSVSAGIIIKKGSQFWLNNSIAGQGQIIWQTAASHYLISENQDHPYLFTQTNKKQDARSFNQWHRFSA